MWLESNTPGRTGTRQQVKSPESLEDYMVDPYAHDNNGYLRNAKTAENREHIYRERIDRLRHGIEVFRGAIDELRRWKP